MSEEIIHAAQEHWSYCSDFMQKALLNRYDEISSKNPGRHDWFAFLAEEFGLDTTD